MKEKGRFSQKENGPFLYALFYQMGKRIFGVLPAGIAPAQVIAHTCFGKPAGSGKRSKAGKRLLAAGSDQQDSPAVPYLEWGGK